MQESINSSFHYKTVCRPPSFPLSSLSLPCLFPQLMSFSVIILGPCRVRPISLPVDISWLKATSACQYRLLVFACVLPASNTADYWRPLIAVLNCCPHSCYLADSSIVYMQMEVGYWIAKTLAPNGKQTIRDVCGEKVRSTEYINTRKGASCGHCDLYFLLVTSSDILTFILWQIEELLHIGRVRLMWWKERKEGEICCCSCTFSYLRMEIF